ncbi:MULTISPECIES: hypothetical protein [Borreliella]|uniref:hypothetical protein n=1 Tax=Borreliella TaxID=64895 RepID=UPI001E2D7A12|nr:MULTISPECIES: hypothetical protein [Borreliella]MCD2381955.1 hypothetical protein [Borreliella americana]MCD2393460.1 hypothetical protein [Borreliella burgdorferi]MCD2416715.1 hypothetical protein [Borreliella burgdorferi]MCD2418777.1 hypothetical protein [Borreliella burgdorferi]
MISDDDFEDIKKRLQADNIKIQFGVGTMEEAKNYVGKLGEPIVVKDKELFAICNGKDTDNRKYYPINKNTKPPIGENIDDYLKELVNWCLENTYPGFLTAEFAKEGSLSRSKLIQAFENTKKFCIPDGRSLPENCFVKEKFGISSAPNLSGRFLRHYDSGGYTDSDGTRSLGDTQSDSFKSHDHDLDLSVLDRLEGRLVANYSFIRRDSNWTDGSTSFVTDIEYGDKIQSWRYPSYTRYTGDSETRPKNTCYISFYRYDW